MKTWVTSDTHLYHSRMIQYCWRPEDFTERILQNWAQIVHPSDVIYHLGDVGFSRKDWGSIISELPGHKILILGNHDRLPIAQYYRMGFMSVMDSAIVRVCYTKHKRSPINFYYRVLLSHKPKIVPEDVDFNLHGHFHNNSSPHWEEGLVNILTPKHRLFSIEEGKYCPVDLAWGLHHDRFINTYQRAERIRTNPGRIESPTKGRK